jgi:hypothetical protein
MNETKTPDFINDFYAVVGQTGNEARSDKNLIENIPEINDMLSAFIVVGSTWPVRPLTEDRHMGL